MRERAITMMRAHGDTALAVALVCLVIAQIWGTDASATIRGVASAGALVLVVPLARRRAMPVLLLALLVASSASATTRRPPSPTSGPASPASCTTWWRTRSASSCSRRGAGVGCWTAIRRRPAAR